MTRASNERSELRVRQDCLLIYEPLAAHYPNPGSAAGLAVRGAGGAPPTASTYIYTVHCKWDIYILPEFITNSLTSSLSNRT